MSAITLLSQEVGQDGIRRYRSKWKITVHSHQYQDVLDLSSSVINLDSSKNTKSVGSLSLTCTGDQNLLNLVFPDDYINVYCDRGDGQGWTRVFFGYVDHINESRMVEATSGRPSTTYALQCSDFQKAFDRTEIYFNPYVSARSDFSSGSFASRNLGGAALRTRGLRVSGTPADMVMNTILLLLGFGAQFVLPASFSPQSRDRLRAQRAEFILNRVSADVRNEIVNIDGYAQFLERIRTSQGITTVVDRLIDPEAGFSTDLTPETLIRYQQEAISRLGRPGNSSLAPNFTGGEAFAVLNTTTSSYAPTLLDVVDIFTFVERSAIDGYTTQLSLWDKQQSVIAFMRGISNEIVNEMFLDLRPVSRDGGLAFGSDFSRNADEVGGNLSTTGGTAGIQYVPALVMREYPFSTIRGIDASQVPITLTGQVTPSGPEVPHIGALQFGAIFSNQPNVPGRHVITIDGINSEDRILGRTAVAAKKHIDVAVVHDSEIVNSRLSRSDTDHFNLFELISESALLGESTKFFMMDLLPIITPIHIMRHGLRTRRLSTRFARFSLSAVAHSRPAPQTIEAVIADATPELNDIAPVPTYSRPQGKGLYLRDWHYNSNTNTTNPRGVSDLLMDSLDALGIRFVCCHYSRGNAIRQLMARGFQVWVFAGPLEFMPNRWRQVLAQQVATARDTMCNNIWVDPENGWEASRAWRTWEALGEALVETQKSGISVTVTTHSGLYARTGRYVASKIAERGGCISPQLYDNMTDQSLTFASEYIVRWERAMHGCFLVPSVGVIGPPKSTVIPASRTDLPTDDPDYVDPEGPFFIPRETTWRALTTRNAASHNGRAAMYLESRRARLVFPNYPATWEAGILWHDLSPNDSYKATITAWPLAASPALVPQATSALTTTERAVRVPDYAPIVDAPEATTIGPEVEPTPEATQEVPEIAGAVDTPDTRRILARWALLNDHWYQHNLEYVSGTISMRGAPEIRVGYRLDLPDRNMSFYVESVTHSWSYGQPMLTTLHVTRGQPNNPYPGYVAPFLSGFAPSENQRQLNSRLAAYAIVPDPLSVARSLKINNQVGVTVDYSQQRRSESPNATDEPGDAGTLSAKYNETIISSDVGNLDPMFMERLAQAEAASLGLQGAGASTAHGAAGTPSEAFDWERYMDPIQRLNNLDIAGIASTNGSSGI